MIFKLSSRLSLLSKYINKFVSINSKYSDNLISKLHTMKLSENQMKLVLYPSVLKLASLFSKHGFEIRIAGGAVRDLLMGKTPKDLDFATPATPNEMKTMFEEEQIRLINKNGEKHGTITARLDEDNFECTTLRIDVQTDGRRAEVEFIKDWKLDAGRRDLTFNALSLGLDGTVYDYFDGIQHLQDRKLCFVGDPEQRIKEDYLRILRYFRFYGVVANTPNEHDEKLMTIISKNSSGLGKISGERIWMEIARIAIGPFGGELILKMIEIGLGPKIGFPEDFDCDSMRSFLDRLQKNNIDVYDIAAVTMISSGFSTRREAEHFIKRVKCSNKEKDIINFIIDQKEIIKCLSILEIQHLMSDKLFLEQRSKENVVFAIKQLVLYCGRKDLLDFVKIENIPIFPLKGGMLRDKVTKKFQIGKELKRLYRIWKDSDFTLTKEELLDSVQNYD